MKKHSVTAALLVAAAAFYAAGWIEGSIVSLPAGGAFETAFWLRLLHRRSGSAK